MPRMTCTYMHSQMSRITCTYMHINDSQIHLGSHFLRHQLFLHAWYTNTYIISFSHVYLGGHLFRDELARLLLCQPVPTDDGRRVNLHVHELICSLHRTRNVCVCVMYMYAPDRWCRLNFMPTSLLSAHYRFFFVYGYIHRYTQKTCIYVYINIYICMYTQYVRVCCWWLV